MIISQFRFVFLCRRNTRVPPACQKSPRAGQPDFFARNLGLACVHPDSKKWLYRFFDSLHVPGPFRGRERFCASRAGPVCAPRSAFSGKSRPPPGNFKKELERTGAVCYNYLVLLGPPRPGMERAGPHPRCAPAAPRNDHDFLRRCHYI